MRKGHSTINQAKLYYFFSDGGLNVTNLQVENNAYFLQFACNFTSNNNVWSLLLKAKFIMSKNQKNLSYKSSSIWIGIKDYYDVVLENTSQMTDIGIEMTSGVLLDVCFLLQVFLIEIDFPCLLKSLQLGMA